MVLGCASDRILKGGKKSWKQTWQCTLQTGLTRCLYNWPSARASPCTRKSREETPGSEIASVRRGWKGNTRYQEGSWPQGRLPRKPGLVWLKGLDWFGGSGRVSARKPFPPAPRRGKVGSWPRAPAGERQSHWSKTKERGEQIREADL